MTARMDARHERGSGTVLVAAMGAVLVAVTWMMLCLVGWTTSAHRAADLADLAALAGARAQTGGGDGCAVARATATANGAISVECSLDATAVDFVVQVRVAVEARPRLTVAGAPSSVARTARAGPTQTQSEPQPPR
ncbi:MAG: flp pilus-assembly TadE/G-like family protein [Acidipropionibacterium jensenii]|nr:flp pilus-assembly TadE/G-like family protein [Acidipropionibacterium jensenii]